MNTEELEVISAAWNKEEEKKKEKKKKRTRFETDSREINNTNSRGDAREKKAPTE